jgi:hypothetical protein
MSFSRSMKIELEGDEPNNKSKSVALSSKEMTAKSPQTDKLEENDLDDESDDGDFKEMCWVFGLAALLLKQLSIYCVVGYYFPTWFRHLYVMLNRMFQHPGTVQCA